MPKKSTTPGDVKVITNEAVVVNKATTHDVQMYYFTVSKSMKNYLMYKKNPEVFRCSVACDHCYQIYNIKEKMTPLPGDESYLVCEICLERELKKRERREQGLDSESEDESDDLSDLKESGQ